MIALVAIHPNSGHHFSQFGKVFESEGIAYVAYAADNALLKMADLQKVEPLDTNDLEATADKIAATATQVLLDVGPPFSLELAKALKERHVQVIAYVDNYEGCNDLAARILEVAGVALYAKELGYYPLEDIEKIEQLRKDTAKKESFLTRHGLDPNLPTLLFIGSAHKGYEELFQTFISENSEGLINWNLLLHRHPRADEQGIEDKADLLNSGWKTPFAISQGSFDEAFGVADVIGYVQTSTAMKGALLGIPSFQWGTSILSKQDLDDFLAYPTKLSSEEALQVVGYKPDWRARLIKFAHSLE